MNRALLFLRTELRTIGRAFHNFTRLKARSYAVLLGAAYIKFCLLGNCKSTYHRALSVFYVQFAYNTT